MSEKLKEIYEKATDKFFKLASKFDGVSEWIFEKTGAKINVGVIVLSLVFIILIIFFVKLVLGIVLNKLTTGDY